MHFLLELRVIAILHGAYLTLNSCLMKDQGASESGQYDEKIAPVCAKVSYTCTLRKVIRMCYKKSGTISIPLKGSTNTHPSCTGSSLCRPWRTLRKVRWWNALLASIHPHTMSQKRIYGLSEQNAAFTARKCSLSSLPCSCTNLRAYT